MLELKEETTQMRDSIMQCVQVAQAQNHSVSAHKLKIQAIEVDLRRIFTYHGQLDQVLIQYGNPAEVDIELPFQFFFDLYKQQRKVVQTLEAKAKEAENVAKNLL